MIYFFCVKYFEFENEWLKKNNLEIRVFGYVDLL